MTDLPVVHVASPGSFAFRFFGIAPAEWVYGYPAYSVTFAGLPGDPRALESQFRAAMSASDSGVEVAMAWQWDGRSVLITLDERVPDPQVMFADVQTALLALHDKEPIEEVIFLNASCTSDHPWEVWSLAQLASPSGPRFGNDCFFD